MSTQASKRLGPAFTREAIQSGERAGRGALRAACRLCRLDQLLLLHRYAHTSQQQLAHAVPALTDRTPPLPSTLNPHTHTRAGVHTLESLLPGLQIDIDLLKAADWARLVVDISGTANKIILLKTLYPRADLTAVVQRSPVTLMWSTEELTDNAKQVMSQGDDGWNHTPFLPVLLQ